MFRDLLPAKWRRYTYIVLGTLLGIEAVIDVLDPEPERIVLGILAVLGFTMAAQNVAPPSPPAVDDVP